MELIIRGVAIYVALFVLMRLAGNRQFAEMTAFDAVLIILIAEVTGQALVGEDYSITAAIVVLATIIGLDVALSLVKRRSKLAQKIVDGIPTLLVNDGELLRKNLDKERVEPDEILSAARELHGIESLDGVKYAVLEANGQITIVPKRRAQGEA